MTSFLVEYERHNDNTPTRSAEQDGYLITSANKRHPQNIVVLGQAGHVRPWARLRASE